MISHDVSDRYAARTAPASPLRQIGPWLAILAVLIAIAAGVYVYFTPPSLPLGPLVAPRTEALPAPETPTPMEPAIRHPITSVQAEPGDVPPLPDFAGSDEVMQNLLANLLGRDSFFQLFHPNEIVRRFVVTVDNLPREKMNYGLSPVKPVKGMISTGASGDGAVISPENASRYAPYVRAIEAVDTRKLATLYVRFYPWFQQEYRTLGYPSGAFNDRVIQTIDDLLATPDVRGPIALTQSKVLYEFADAGLEARSAGQKVLLRMGSENAARVKAKLRDLRRALTGAGVNEQSR